MKAFLRKKILNISNFSASTMASLSMVANIGEIYGKANPPGFRTHSHQDNAVLWSGIKSKGTKRLLKGEGINYQRLGLSKKLGTG